jgi:hypothetical protein
MRDCFHGRPHERNCLRCQAHYTKGGQCCFGKSHDPQDSSPTGCKSCVHERDCSITCRAQYVPAKPTVAPAQPAYSVPIQPVYRTPNVAPSQVMTGQMAYSPGISNQFITPQGAQFQGGQPAAMLMQYAMPKRDPIKFEDDSSFWEKAAVMTGWGMLEGGLEMALYAFRKHRPE